MLIEVWVCCEPYGNLIVKSSKHNFDLEVAFDLTVCILRLELIGDVILRYSLVLFDRLTDDLHINIVIALQLLLIRWYLKVWLRCLYPCWR